jgi:hypothetical protein
LQYLIALRAARHNHIFALTGSHPHQRNLFSQDLSLPTEQNSKTSSGCAKQILGRHLPAAASIRNFQILSDPKAKGSLSRRR